MTPPPPRSHRTPPHDVEAEESLLGAMLLSKDAVSLALERRVRAEDFHTPAHRSVFTAITALYDEGGAIDPVTVADVLARAGQLETVGGRPALLRLQAQTPASANAQHYATIVAELALLRGMIGVASEIAEIAYGAPEDVHEALDHAEALVFEIADHQVPNTLSSASTVMAETLDEINALYTDPDAGRGLGTGFIDLDHLLLGLQPSTLNIVAARPAMGKSALALAVAAHASIDARRPVLFFSLEMGRVELGKRLLSLRAEIDARKTQTGRIAEADWLRIAQATAEISAAPLHIDDNPHCTVMEMRAKARRLKSRIGDLGLVVVDYLQLMTPSTLRKAENRQVEVAEISRQLKILARELECPVLALAQLNRQVEYRADKRPMLADLRESGSLEQDADVVLFLYRDEVYDPDSADAGTAEVVVAKHRSGPTGVIRLAYLPDTGPRFANLAVPPAPAAVPPTQSTVF